MVSPRVDPEQSFHCGKYRHIKKYCRDLKTEKEGHKEKKEQSSTSRNATESVAQDDSDSKDEVLITIDDKMLCMTNSREQTSCIIDSGATTHMCHEKQSFVNLYQLENPIDVMLGDSRSLTAVARGDVVLNMMLPSGESKSSKLCDVLYVLKLSYNLVSVTKVTQKGKTVKFTSLLAIYLTKATI